MRVALLCCVGKSQHSYKVLAIRETHEDARDYMNGLTYMKTEDRPPVGFIVPWMYGRSKSEQMEQGGDESEQMDIDFIWDTRLQVKVQKKTGVY